MTIEPYASKPEGFSFLGRFPKNKEYKDYTEMVITEDGVLACLCNDHKWYPFRKATEEDRKVAAICFRNWGEYHMFYDNLLIAS